MPPMASAVPGSMFKETHTTLPLVASRVLSVSHLPLPLPLPLPMPLPLHLATCSRTWASSNKSEGKVKPKLQPSAAATAARVATEARVTTAARVATATTCTSGEGSLLRSIPRS